MKGSVQAAAALGVGYVLGRNRRLRTAALMAAATAIGGKGVGRMAAQRGMKKFGNTEVFGKLAPQLGAITETVRGDLLDAGRAAAAAAINNRVDSLTDSIHERAERLRNPGEAVADAAGEATGKAGQAGSSAARAGSSAGRAASSGARRTASSAGGATQRPSGRRGAAASDEDERGELDERGEDDYQADDLERDAADDSEDTETDDEDAGPDNYEDGEPGDEDAGPDNYEDTEADDEDGEPDDDGPGRRRASAPRQRSASRSPVSRARR